ncbi:hypothetical protein [Sphaerisporangium perillae]|uniref:hypothetical protein n=1 Tax=Sphaerisporangium perillae TaxID=2935860 RepID=UPI00200D5E2D|nr:hypothetical protein [Sphaerisporangium perillae]
MNTLDKLGLPGSGVSRALARMTTGIHPRHRWNTEEAIGHVVTERCEVCDRTRVRVRTPRLPGGMRHL